MRAANAEEAAVVSFDPVCDDTAAFGCAADDDDDDDDDAAACDEEEDDCCCKERVVSDATASLLAMRVGDPGGEARSMGLASVPKLLVA